MRFSPGDWKWGVTISAEDLVPILWAVGILALAVGGCLLLAGCGLAPKRWGGTVGPQDMETTAEVSPDAGGGDAEAERSGSEGRAEAGRDLRQSIRDMSEQVTDMSKTIEQHTTTIQETVQNQQSGQSELSGQVAEAVESIGTLEQRVETLTDNSRQVRGLKTELGQVAEQMGNVQELVQKTESTVQNYGISEKRLELERDRMAWHRALGMGGLLIMVGLICAAIAADGPKGTKGKLVFYGIGVVLVLAAVGVITGYA